MIMKAVAIYDKKTGYMIPGFYQSEAQAIRAFTYDVNSVEMNLIKANPHDFNLQVVGEYNTETGEIIPSKIEIICDASQVIKEV